MPDTLDGLKAALQDRYAIQRELGRGGMATVYLAEDLKHHRPVAIKVLKPELAAALGPDRFLREIEVTAQLHHLHILPLYDSGSARGAEGQGEGGAEWLFYVMPCVEGESLRARLDRERQLPLEEALQLTREVAEALSYAHSHGVIHRDIKPENILLESGHALVADFGIAKAVTDAGGERLTGTGIAVGTPAYMSPEQASGIEHVDGRSDLYSLGCVLYEMLAGHPPFTGSTAHELLARHAMDPVPPLRTGRATVPEPIVAAMERALAKVPADRQRSALEFAEQITAATTAAEPATVAPPPRRRLRVRGLAVPAVLVILAAAVGLWRVLARGGGTAASAANRVVVLPYENQTGDPALEPIGRMVAEWITEGLAQTSEVQVVPSLIVLQTLAGIEPEHGGSARPPVQELARLTEAGLVVAGSYYRHGAGLEFHSEVLNVKSGRPLGMVQPVLGRPDDPTAAIDTVRLRVMGVLAARLDWGWDIPASVQPPSYDAYRAYAEGQRRWIAGQYLKAASEFEHAYALDSTYLRVMLNAVSAYNNAGRPAQADSVLQFLEPRRDRLSPYDRYHMDYYLARRRGDREAQLQAARAAVALAPVSTERFALVLSLEAVNRPREALAEFEGAVQHLPESPMSWYAVWDGWTRLYHQLDEHEEELKVAREARARLSGSLYALEYEGRALAALGRTDELDALTEEILAQRVRPGLTPCDVLLVIAQELRAHGHPAEAAETGDRALAWYRAQPAQVLARGWRRDLEASLLYLRERWPDAAAVWDSIPIDSAEVVDRLGTSGVLAARLGLPDSARAIGAELATLDRPRLNGWNTVWRARIAALLGEKDSAVALLRQAFAEGLEYGIWLHTDMDLKSLRDYKAYRELVRPKG